MLEAVIFCTLRVVLWPGTYYGRGSTCNDSLYDICKGWFPLVRQVLYSPFYNCLFYYCGFVIPRPWHDGSINMAVYSLSRSLWGQSLRYGPPCIYVPRKLVNLTCESGFHVWSVWNTCFWYQFFCCCIFDDDRIWSGSLGIRHFSVVSLRLLGRVFDAICLSRKRWTVAKTASTRELLMRILLLSGSLFGQPQFTMIE